MRALLPIAVILLAGVAGCSSDRMPTSPASAPDTVAEYRVTFTATWSAATHPTDFPASAHFSGLVGATHDARVAFWHDGELASPGIQRMAELGSKTPLTDEIAAAQAAGTAGLLLSGDGIRPSPGEAALDFRITARHPLVTLVSMIAPSPDWFVGVDALPLMQQDRWVDSLSVALHAWDAGTDDGASYTSPDAPANPHVPTARLVDGPFQGDRSVPALGTFTFVRRR